MNLNNYLTIGNDELKGEIIKKGDIVQRKDIKGTVIYPISTKGIECEMLGFITLDNGDSYLVAVNNILIDGWEKV